MGSHISILYLPISAIFPYHKCHCKVKKIIKTQKTETENTGVIRGYDLTIIVAGGWSGCRTQHDLPKTLNITKHPAKPHRFRGQHGPYPSTILISHLIHSKANLVLVIRNIYITSSYTYEMYVYPTFHTNKSYLTCTFAATKHKSNIYMNKNISYWYMYINTI